MNDNPDWSKVAGRWLMLVEDEPFNRSHNEIVELSAPAAEAAPHGDLIVDLRSDRRLVLAEFDAVRGTMGGTLYTANEDCFSFSGDPGRLWEGLDDADVDDPRFDSLPISDPVFLVRDELADAYFAGLRGSGD